MLSKAAWPRPLDPIGIERTRPIDIAHSRSLSMTTRM